MYDNRHRIDICVFQANKQQCSYLHRSTYLDFTCAFII